MSKEFNLSSLEIVRTRGLDSFFLFRCDISSHEVDANTKCNRIQFFLVKLLVDHVNFIFMSCNCFCRILYDAVEQEVVCNYKVIKSFDLKFNRRKGVSYMKKGLSVVLGTVIALTLSACGNGAATDNKSTQTTQPAQTAAAVKKYTFGTDATYPPFEFQKDGKYIGIDIDLINAIAKEEGFEVELKPMNFKGIIPAITSKQLDGAIAGISITDERKQVVGLSDPYYKAGLSLIVREDNTTIKTPEDLKGKVIAIKKGTSGAKLADEYGKTYGATVKYFDDSPAMYQEVANKNADVTLEDFPVISYKIAVDPNSKLKIVGDRLNGDNYGIAVSKDNEELMKKINDGIKKVKANGKYDEIISTYMGKSTK